MTEIHLEHLFRNRPFFEAQYQAWFQVDYINSLKDMLAPFFEVKSLHSGTFKANFHAVAFSSRKLDLSRV